MRDNEIYTNKNKKRRKEREKVIKPEQRGGGAGKDGEGLEREWKSNIYANGSSKHACLSYDRFLQSKCQGRMNNAIATKRWVE